MPHATTPTTSFQALILCGPGESLQPFTSSPSDFPKALIPIANRPMVWYALDWCHRMGVSNITLVTPSVCAPSLEAALSTNPHLTSLPAPRPTVLAPEDLTLTTGTAELFRIPEIQDSITGDFVVLPCDLLCEMSGLSLLDSWLVLQGGLSHHMEIEERMGRRGGLGVWYHTKDSIAEGGVGVKKEETDFLATVETEKPIVPPVAGALRPKIEEVVLTMPTAVLKDKLDEDKGLKLRHAAIRKHGNLKMRMTSRDSHIYLFPYWVKEFVRRNETFDSLGEDVLGWWAKAGWQDGLATKLKLGQSLGQPRSRRQSRRLSKPANSAPETPSDFIDLAALSSTSFRPRTAKDTTTSSSDSPPTFASRVPNGDHPHPYIPTKFSSNTAPPPLLAYVHPSQPTSSLLRRIDTVPLLLSSSLFLAKLPPAPQAPTNPFVYENKVHPSSAPNSSLRLTLDAATCLVDANVTFTSKSTIKESVIGAGCVLGSPFTPAEGQDAVKNAPPGVRLNRCLLMEGAIVEQGAVLNGCVLGRRCKVGKGSDLRDCTVQEGFVVPEGTTAKAEVFAGFDAQGGIDGDEGMYNDGGEDVDDVEEEEDEYDDMSS